MSLRDPAALLRLTPSIALQDEGENEAPRRVTLPTSDELARVFRPYPSFPPFLMSENSATLPFCHCVAVTVS